MELGNFLGKLKGEDKTEPKKFLALLLTDEVVQSAVWNVNSGVTEIVALGTPVEWDGDTGTTGELITAVDATISSATEGLEDEPSEVILGIPHSWTDKNGVLGVKKEFIAKIRKEIDLVPIGYVIITDSILSYLKMQEGTPATSILIQVSRDELTILLVRLGQIEAIETIGRSDDIVEDVSEAIARFKVLDNLPSRIILFNSMHNLDDIIQNLLSTDWPKDFNFLHTPKIEALPKDIAITALTVAGGTEVAKSLGYTVTTGYIKSPELIDDTVEEESVADEDVSIDAPSPVLETDDFLSAEDIGFSDDVEPEVDNVVPAKFIEVDDQPEEEVKINVPSKKFVMPSMALPKFKLPSFKPNFHALNSTWLMIGGGLLLLAGLIFYLIYFLPKAVVNIKVVPRSLDQNVELTLSTLDSSINFSEAIVPAEVETLSETGEKILETTGKKTIGDAAKGEVTLYNRTSSTKSFAKGTKLTLGSLKFSLDQDVSVASKSAGSDYVDVPGKASVAVTADSIGEDSNISSGSEFVVASFGKDSYVAKNDSAFKGGTSQEVQVVAKEDPKSLTDALVAEILEKIKVSSASRSEGGRGLYLIADSAKTEDLKFSAKSGDVAKNLSLSLTLKVTLLRYNTQDVTTLVESSIDQAVPAGFVRADLPSTVEVSASTISDDETTVKGLAKVQVALLPVIDQDQIIANIKGKTGGELESVFSTTIPGYQSAMVTVTPSWLPPLLKSVPKMTKNITLQLTPSL